jgi:hypothetical protein
MAEYLTKEFKKNWLFKADYGQDYCWIVAEHNDFPVRLFFNFDECGWADIVRHYTNGSSYNDDYIGSWHFAKYDLEYSYAVIRDNIENYFYKFEESMKEERKSIKESEYDDYVNLDNLHFGYNDKYGFMEFGFYKNIQIKYDNGYTIIFGQLPSKEWAFAITDVSKGEGNLIDSRVNFVKKDTLIDLNNALKNLGIDKTWNELSESKKSTRKSLKEYRTVGFEHLVRDTIVEILEDPHSDLFDLGMADGIITYDNKGRARITSNGDVDMDYITLPTYFWSSGYTPSNKKMAKLCEDMMEGQKEFARERIFDDYKDELIEIGIKDEEDENLTYDYLFDLGLYDIADRLDEYEMDLEGMDLYTDVLCQLEETDEGIELTVSMTIQDEYGHALVKDYKSNTVLLQEDVSEENGDLEEFITDAIREVTEQF